MPELNQPASTLTPPVARCTDVWNRAYRADLYGGTWAAPLAEGTEGDLGGVEELGASRGVDGAEEDALRAAGDEVADVVIAVELGHGLAEGVPGGEHGGSLGLVDGEIGAVCAVPHVGAAGDGGVRVDAG